MNKDNSITFISIARVVATLSIVICHIVKYYTFIPWHMQLGQFFNVGVPMFICISGYLYGLKSVSGGGNLDDWKGFMWKRYLKVSLPVQLFSLILLFGFGIEELWHTLILILNLQGMNFLFDTDFFDVGHYMSHTWFITVILLCYTITPLLYKMYRKGKLNWAKIGIMWLFAFILPFIGVFLGNVVLFVMSFLVAAANKLKRYNIIYLTANCFIAVLMRLTGRYYFDDTIFYNSTICMISHIILAISIMLIIREMTFKYDSINDIHNNAIFRFVENYSFYIYITHYCIISFIFDRFGILIATVLFFVFVGLLSVLLDFIHKKTEQCIIKIVE